MKQVKNASKKDNPEQQFFLKNIKFLEKHLGGLIFSRHTFFEIFLSFEISIGFWILYTHIGYFGKKHFSLLEATFSTFLTQKH
jgi:hypothetical protein